MRLVQRAAFGLCIVILVATPIWAGPSQPTLATAAHTSGRHGASTSHELHGSAAKSTSHATGTHRSHTHNMAVTHGHGGATSKGASSSHAKTSHAKTAHVKTAPSASTLSPNVPRNPKLQAKLQAMLPSGVTLDEAAKGFKNQGQFIAALHVSQNLGIPFADLKTRMVDQHLSLGQAIQSARPTADATTAARRGERQAATDLR